MRRRKKSSKGYQAWLYGEVAYLNLRQAKREEDNNEGKRNDDDPEGYKLTNERIPPNI